MQASRSAASQLHEYTAPQKNDLKHYKVAEINEAMLGPLLEEYSKLQINLSLIDPSVVMSETPVWVAFLESATITFSSRPDEELSEVRQGQVGYCTMQELAQILGCGCPVFVSGLAALAHFPTSTTGWHKSATARQTGVTFNNFALSIHAPLQLLHDRQQEPCVVVAWCGDAVPVVAPPYTACLGNSRNSSNLTPKYMAMVGLMHEFYMQQLGQRGYMHALQLCADTHINDLLMSEDRFLGTSTEISQHFPQHQADVAFLSSAVKRRDPSHATRFFQHQCDDGQVLYISVVPHYSYLLSCKEAPNILHSLPALLQYASGLQYSSDQLAEMAMPTSSPLDSLSVSALCYVVRHYQAHIPTIAAECGLTRAQGAAILQQMNAAAQGAGVKQAMVEAGITPSAVRAVLLGQQDLKMVGILALVQGVSLAELLQEPGLQKALGVFKHDHDSHVAIDRFHNKLTRYLWSRVLERDGMIERLLEQCKHPNTAALFQAHDITAEKIQLFDAQQAAAHVTWIGRTGRLLCMLKEAETSQIFHALNVSEEKIRTSGAHFVAATERRVTNIQAQLRAGTLASVSEYTQTKSARLLEEMCSQFNCSKASAFQHARTAGNENTALTRAFRQCQAQANSEQRGKEQELIAKAKLSQKIAFDSYTRTTTNVLRLLSAEFPTWESFSLAEIKQAYNEKVQFSPGVAFKENLFVKASQNANAGFETLNSLGNQTFQARSAVRPNRTKKRKADSM